VRLARTLSPAPAPIGGVEPWRPRDGETYLLTGAASGIGGEVALHLARQARVSLVITGRRSLPSPSGEGAAEVEVDAGVRERLALLRELEETGARVRYEAVDAADRDAMDDVVRRARRDLGPIRGVVHCAGVVDADALRLTAKSAEALSRVLSPKVRGTVVVDEVTREDPLRVFAAFSSVSASRSGWGKCLADYAAANFFIDQYCQLRAAQGRTGRTVAINWALWRGRGMGQALGIDAIAERSGLAALEPEVALRAFDEALGRDEAVLHVYQALPPGRARPTAPVAPAAPEPGRDSSDSGDVQRVVLEVLGEQLGLSAGAVDAGATFRDLGLDSQGALEALRKLEARLRRKLYPTLFFEHETPEALARHLSGSNGVQGVKPAEAGALPVPLATQPEAGAVPSREPATASSFAGPKVRDAEPRDIAIVGMACRFPGADGPEAYWELLRSGKSAIREAPADRFPAETYFDPSGTAAHQSYSRWGAFVEEPYAFDAMFFGISPREAVSMDPQQRLFLEVAWQAVQRAGYARERPTDVGVFVGCESNAYAEHFINSQRHAAILATLAGSAWFRALADGARADLLATLARHLAPAEITSDVVAGNGLNEVAARLSHFLDARGPSLIVNSACSSSLVAMHYACDSLRRGETSMAIAGGAFLNFGTTASVFLSKLKALSPTGECRPFDRRANGMVLGEGVGALVLKPLAAALRDRDHVHAVIKGSAVSNDGRSSGITVPTAAGQAEAIRRAYEAADVDPATVSYVECHGTATSLGDPIEVQGLARSIGAGHGPSNPCTIGSAKGAVGHMLAAAGASSVLRVALALERRTIPPTAGYEEPSPHIDFGHFQVASGSPRAWTSAGPRRAGVNAFGFGGTNCHVILEERPAVVGPAAGPEDPGGAHLLCLYGRTPGALSQWSRNVAGAVAGRPDLTPAVVCAALHRSQRPLAHVAACVVRDRAELLAALDGISAGAERAGLHRGKVNPRRASRLTVGLGADWSPARTDAEAFVAGSRRLATRLADALAALRGAASPEQAGLLSQYVVARALGELGMVAD
jgi:3-oxoacyl-(acyl-carrier-protein) synthase/NAD(P)-dependent dehydrogenase (short-subunit alcohol dehydrogenase family)